MYLSFAACYFFYLSISLLIQTEEPKYLGFALRDFAVRDFALRINNSASTGSGLLSWSCCPLSSRASARPPAKGLHDVSAEFQCQFIVQQESPPGSSCFSSRNMTQSSTSTMLTTVWVIPMTMSFSSYLIRYPSLHKMRPPPCPSTAGASSLITWTNSQRAANATQTQQM